MGSNPVRVKSMILKIDTRRYLAWHSVLLGQGQEQWNEEDKCYSGQHFGEANVFILNSYSLPFLIKLTLSKADRSCKADAFAVWAIFGSNQWSTTSPSKAVVYAVVSMGKCI